MTDQKQTLETTLGGTIEKHIPDDVESMMRFTSKKNTSQMT